MRENPRKRRERRKTKQEQEETRIINNDLMHNIIPQEIRTKELF
jgi:hypothetical protein